MSGLACKDAASIVRLGVVGAGFISQVTHLNCFTELSDCRVVAIADNRHELRELVARRHAIGQQMDDPAALIGSPDIDALVIAMPRRAMGPAVAAAVATGKPVLAEKPMAHTHEQGKRIVAAAAHSGSSLLVGFMKRHDAGVAHFRALLQRLRAGDEAGDIVHVAMRDYCATYATPIPHHYRIRTPRPYRYAEWPTVPDWLPSEQREDYEVTLNVASHDINLLRFLLGDPLKARAMRVRKNGAQLAVLDAGAFDIALELGRVDTGRWEQSIDVYFRRGLLQLRLPSPLARQETAQVVWVRGGRHETWDPPPEQRIWAFKAQAAQFLDVVRRRAEPVASGRDALADLELIEDLWRSVTWSAR